MKKVLSACLVCFTVVAVMSCGTGKKLKSANAEIQRLDSVNNSLNQQIAGLKDNMNDLNAQKDALNANLNNAKQGMANQQKQMQSLQSSLQSQRKAMEDLRAKIADALNGFKSDEVQVTYKDGLVYVSLQDKLLFKSGSAILDERGKQALGTVASVLNQDTSIKIMVVGHTDSVAFKKSYKDNWQLSTERANTIVRILRDSYSVDPARLTAAGRSKYSPVADNATPEGRASNRRTEIVLTPDLSEVWNLVNASSQQ
ncbi:OmpA family protein [Pinibacter soli]|uniref:OmpA family protein n=1 Tax=Pinibacter soli TaxID=3044211 RepID=A0ABT6RE58_9BACT|nr:OmpA family protein [Pinibacter soli]MDI3320815.1 OmpA family protein [Pinibacter soli]